MSHIVRDFLSAVRVSASCEAARVVLSMVAMTADELEARTDAFVCRVLKFLRALRREPVIDTIARQLSRSSSGVSANYHASRRSRSRAEFVARLGVVVEEADETVHWLEQVEDLGVAPRRDVAALLDESRQLRAIFARSVATARRNSAATPSRGRK